MDLKGTLFWLLLSFRLFTPYNFLPSFFEYSLHWAFGLYGFYWTDFDITVVYISTFFGYMGLLVL